MTNPRRSLQLATLVSLSPILWACAPIATVDETDPQLPTPVAGVPSTPEITKARQLDEAATAQMESNPKASMVDSETATELTLDAAPTLPLAQGNEAIALYDYSIARLVEAAVRAGAKPWEHEVVLQGPKGPIYVNMADDSKGAWVPGTDHLIPTDRLEVGGAYFTDRAGVDGVGIPLVSKGKGRTDKWAPDEHYFAVTAIVHVKGDHCYIEVVDPDLTPTVTLAGKTRPVAADYSAPMALGITETSPQKFGIAALLRTDDYMDEAQMIMVEPYRPNKIPLILVHGLLDSPTSWTPMINELNSDPEIRKKYQIWTYRYPSGLPFPLSAEMLREEIAAIYKEYPDTQKAVVVGHSMGGLLAHMLICDSGDQFCIDALGQPLDKFKVEPDEHKTLEGAFYFKRSPYVAEAIFMATPHRGADLASNILGRIGASLIHLPDKMADLGPKLTSQTEGEEVIERFPNSIDTLRPESPEVKALNDLKIPASTPFYSIVGDRGRGDTPNSSDGVVAYKSSHLDGAKSELVVPSDHLVQQNPQAIAEVDRILKNP
jgi:pimeloyl-ACP methyl ester carboxylesterase